MRRLDELLQRRREDYEEIRQIAREATLTADHRLTKHGQHVMESLIPHFSNREIAGMMDVSHVTVFNRRKKMLEEGTIS